jgi:hypothetical protein
MTITIEIRHTVVVVAEGGGRYRLLVFADMAEGQARRLAREYGYDEGDIVAVSHEALHYRRQLADELVQEVLDRLPFLEHRTPDQMLAIVRCIVPQTVKIEK